MIYRAFKTTLTQLTPQVESSVFLLLLFLYIVYVEHPQVSHKYNSKYCIFYLKSSLSIELQELAEPSIQLLCLEFPNDLQQTTQVHPLIYM